MPFFTGLKRFLTVPEPLLAVLKLSPALQFTRYFFTLLKLTSLVGVAIICAFMVYVMAHSAVSPAYRVSTLHLVGFDNAADALRGPKRDNLSIEERDLYTVLPDLNTVLALRLVIARFRQPNTRS
jgi:hypothetical protein